MSVYIRLLTVFFINKYRSRTLFAVLLSLKMIFSLRALQVQTDRHNCNNLLLGIYRLQNVDVDFFDNYNNWRLEIILLIMQHIFAWKHAAVLYGKIYNKENANKYLHISILWEARTYLHTRTYPYVYLHKL